MLKRVTSAHSRSTSVFDVKGPVWDMTKPDWNHVGEWALPAEPRSMQLPLTLRLAWVEDGSLLDGKGGGDRNRRMSRARADESACVRCLSLVMYVLCKRAGWSEPRGWPRFPRGDTQPQRFSSAPIRRLEMRATTRGRRWTLVFAGRKSALGWKEGCRQEG